MMQPEQIAKLKQSLVLHEGRKNFPYTDSIGKLTIGIGYNLTDRGVSDHWIDHQFMQDIQYFHDQLSQLSFWSQLNDDRQVILIDMAFMGWKKFMSFKRMLGALEREDYQLAADEMLDSKWASQVGNRAKQLSNGMILGVYDV